MKTLTLPMVIATVRTILETRGNFVYNPDGYGCYYVPTQTYSNGNPLCSSKQQSGCFVGEILRMNDMITPEIAEYDKGVLSAIHDKIIHVDSNYTAMFLNFLQSAQDDGASWNDSYHNAKEAFYYKFRRDVLDVLYNETYI